MLTVRLGRCLHKYLPYRCHSDLALDLFKLELGYNNSLVWVQVPQTTQLVRPFGWIKTFKVASLPRLACRLRKLPIEGDDDNSAEDEQAAQGFVSGELLAENERSKNDDQNDTEFIDGRDSRSFSDL